MPLFSEHISNMYYGGSPSYHTTHKAPSYGYKSSFSPLGTSYSASYLNPGGSYSKHSSLSSYSRAPLTPRWIPGVSRSYSPLLTPISERGASSPIRVNSPRRIPISSRTYGTPNYIQRPININTESIDVSRDRYRPKPAETSARAPSPPPPPASVPALVKGKVDSVKDNGNSPFMPRVDGKPVTGIDSSPGKPRSTIKRGRTVVRLHTIKRKEKDSPRKPTPSPQSQNSEENKEAEKSESAVTESESLSWREKLSDDLIYVDKKEKKSLGTKLVEKFIVKDSNEKGNKVEKSDTNNLIEEESSNTVPSTSLPESDVPSTSKSLDRRCSMELLAEQASLLDSLIRGENLSTASLDISKIGIADDAQNKFSSSNSIKRRKIDDKGNPLKTTKSDHSLHDTLIKSIKKDSQLNKDSKIMTKGRSLKKSHSGGSICRLDSITEFPKEAKEPMDLPAIQERFSPKEEKSEKQSKVKAKITASVEISPPSSPLKFRIENITVEEKHHMPKKEVSFTYETDEMPVQDITLQGPKNTNNLRRAKERNSIKQKSIKMPGTEPISPEPDDGNFWAKIGKRETVYLVKRKQNLEEAKEKNKRAFLWFPEDEEAETSSETVSDESYLLKQEISSNLPSIPNANLTTEVVFPKLENSKAIKNSSSDKLSKPIATEISTETKKDNIVFDSSKRKLIRQDAEIMEEIAQTSKDSCNSKIVFKDNLPKVDTETIKINNSLDESKDILGDSIQTLPQSQTKNTTVMDLKSKDDLDATVVADIPDAKSVTDIKLTLKRTKSAGSNQSQNAKIITEMKTENNLSLSATQTKTTNELPPQVLMLRAKSEGKSLKKEHKPISGIDLSLNSSTRLVMAHEYTPGLETMIRNKSKKMEKDSKAILAKITTNSNDDDKTGVKILSTEKTVEETNPVTTELIQNLLDENKDESKDSLFKDSSEKLKYTFRSSKTSSEVLTNDEIPPATKGSKEKDDDKVFMSTKGKTIECAKSNIDIISAKSQEKLNDVLTLKTQVTSKIEEKQPESSIKEQVEPLKDAKSNISKQNPSSTKIYLQKDEKTESKKKKNKAETKEQKDNTGQKVEIKREKRSSVLKEKICETCKKPVLSDGSSKSKSLIDKTIGTKTSITVQNPTNNVPEVKSSVTVEKSTDNELEVKLGSESSVVDSSNSNENDAPCSKVIKTTDIPNEIVAGEGQFKSQDSTGEENKAENGINESKDAHELKVPSIKQAKLSSSKPVKEEKATKPLIATPRPLKKRVPQVIHSDSDSSSEEESSEEEDSDSSEECCEFYECENNPDGRTSTGSNDSGFDSSAPTSPASFLQIKKDCDVNCHRKCEKLTANLCGVNQRLLVEALASRTASKRGGESPGPSSSNASAPDGQVGDSELELEQSTAYSIFRKTGRFTPPAKSIPRFRKYNIEDFQFIKVLGKGSFGKVLLAELRDTEYYYAVKCLKKDVVLEDDDVECTLIERKVLALGTNHPYLCHLFATFQTDSHLFFVMEYLNGGDLMFHIQQSGRFPETRARFYGAEIVSGLKFLHKRGIVYRDLKLDNILLDYEGHVRIADFGMCKLQIYLDKTADTFCGTPDYMAPEIIKGLKYNQTVDWWSFGVLLYEMLIGQSPFSGCDEDELFWSICNEMPSYPRFLSREALTVLTRLLDKDAKTRLGGTDCMHGDVREQDFFHPVHWDKLERRELETPFKPRVRHPLDTQYFDREFTGERPRLTAVEPHVIRSMDQEPFRGFSYTNPNATDR